MAFNYSIGVRIVIVAFVLLEASVQDTYAQKRAPVKSFRKLPIKKVVAHKKLIGVIETELGYAMQSVSVKITDGNKLLYETFTDKDGCFEIGFPKIKIDSYFINISSPQFVGFENKLVGNEIDSRLNIVLKYEPQVAYFRRGCGSTGNFRDVSEVLTMDGKKIELPKPPLRIKANPIYDEADIQRAGSVEAILKDHPFLQRGR